MSGIRSGEPARGRPTATDPAGTPRAAVTPRPAADARPAAVARPRPDAGPLRIAVGMSAVAAASALVTALASPPAAGAAAGQAQTAITVPADPAPIVRHVTKYVKLAPGQTAPPHAVVKQAPAPKPRTVVVTTRQSGAKP